MRLGGFFGLTAPISSVCLYRNERYHSRCQHWDLWKGKRARNGTRNQHCTTTRRFDGKKNVSCCKLSLMPLLTPRYYSQTIVPDGKWAMASVNERRTSFTGEGICCSFVLSMLRFHFGIMSNSGSSPMHTSPDHSRNFLHILLALYLYWHNHSRTLRGWINVVTRYTVTSDQSLVVVGVCERKSNWRQFWDYGNDKSKRELPPFKPRTRPWHLRKPKTNQMVQLPENQKARKGRLMRRKHLKSLKPQREMQMVRRTLLFGIYMMNKANKYHNVYHPYNMYYNWDLISNGSWL